MIQTLVRSAFKNGCLSVESEGLIRQVLILGSPRTDDLAALEELYAGIDSGVILREAHRKTEMPPISTLQSKSR